MVEGEWANVSWAIRETILDRGIRTSFGSLSKPTAQVRSEPTFSKFFLAMIHRVGFVVLPLRYAYR